MDEAPRPAAVGCSNLGGPTEALAAWLEAMVAVAVKARSLLGFIPHQTGTGLHHVRKPL